MDKEIAYLLHAGQMARLRIQAGGMRTGFFEVSPGNKSMGRLISFVGCLTGSALCVGALVLAFAADPGNGVGMAAVGAGIFSGGALLKGWQKRSENGGPREKVVGGGS